MISEPRNFGQFIPQFAGVEIIVSGWAMMETDERLFPASRHRSDRITKKLIKRHGGVFKKKPAVFRRGNQLIIHPVLYESLKSKMRAKAMASHDSAFMNVLAGKNPW